MKIAIEITPLLAAREQYGDKSGVYQITYNFIKHLLEIDSKDKITLFDYPSLFNNTVNIEIYNLLKKNVDVLSFHFPQWHDKYKFIKSLPSPITQLSQPFTKRVYSFLKDINLKKVLDQYDIVHSSESVYLAGNQTKNVITINDLVTVLFPRSQPAETVELHQRKLVFAKEKADKVIAISKNTKNDLVKHIKVPLNFYPLNIFYIQEHLNRERTSSPWSKHFADLILRMGLTKNWSSQVVLVGEEQKSILRQ